VNEARVEDPEFLWRRVEAMSHQSPYAFGSHRSAHLDAARDLARKLGLQGEELTAWTAFVERKTMGMSNFAGD
jgi:hypothetical protein